MPFMIPNYLIKEYVVLGGKCIFCLALSSLLQVLGGFLLFVCFQICGAPVQQRSVAEGDRVQVLGTLEMASIYGF
jgi:hypothetical protein